MEEETFISFYKKCRVITLNGIEADEVEITPTGVSLTFNGRDFWVGFDEIRFGTFNSEKLILSNVECKTLAENVELAFLL